MPNLIIDLSKVALILWSGMLIISGSIWILSSQVRRLGEIMEGRLRTTASGVGSMAQTRAYVTVTATRATTPHSAPLGAVRVARTVAAR